MEDFNIAMYINIFYTYFKYFNKLLSTLITLLIVGLSTPITRSGEHVTVVLCISSIM